MKYLVAQLGARMHYAVPRILYENDMLGFLYTDLFSNSYLLKILGLYPSWLRPTILKRMLGRKVPSVPSSSIHSFNSFAIEYYMKRRIVRNSDDQTAVSLWAGAKFCNLILNSKLDNINGVYTFNSAGLELLTELKARNMRTVMEQTIAPRIIELDLLTRECEKYPDWQNPTKVSGVEKDFIEREYLEWGKSDSIICGSNFVKKCIEKAGGPTERCKVINYGVDTVNFNIKKEFHNGPLRVLTVGAVGLRKGTPYILEAAKYFGDLVEFRIVGEVNINLKSIITNDLKRNIDITGSIPRSDIHDQYSWADIFLLPSICEGSATVIYEALAAGLPVITTENSGSIVRNNIDGVIIDYGSSVGLIQAIENYLTHPKVLDEQRQGLLASKYRAGLGRYSEELVSYLAIESK